MRHFFVFVESLGINDYEITGDMIRRFINEASKTNAGSMNYIIYSINLITKNLKRNKIADMQSDFHYFMPKSKPIRLILPYTQEEINRILQAIKSDSISAKRNRAIILLAFNTGLRGIDIVNLQLSDINWKTGVVRVVQSKTKYPVTIPICGMVMNAIADYILEERPACDEKSVFLKAVSPHAPLKGTSSLDSILEKLCRKAGVEKKPYRSFHSLRRSFATELSVAEVPLTSISQMLGHQSIDSDRPYLSFNRKQTSLCACGFEEIPINHGIYAGKLNFKYETKHKNIPITEANLYRMVIMGFAEIPLRGGVYA
jgi:integrase